MKVSELTNKTNFRRATKNLDEFGNRIYQELEYNIKIDLKTEDNYVIRYFAKIIDIIPLYLIFYFLLDFIQTPLVYPLCFFLVLIFNSISESLTGQTIGKKIFNLKVIDDYGNYPKLSKSIIRNFLFFLNFQYELFHYKKDDSEKNSDVKFSPDVNNRICKTYVVKESIYKMIKSMMSKRNVA